MAEAARCLKRREREPSDEHRRCATASSAVRQRGVPSRRQPVRRHATNRPMRKQRALAMNALARLTFDMRGGRKWAKPACGRPLDGRVRHLAEKRHIRPCAQQGDCAATGKCVDVHERHSVRDLDERGNSELHCPGKTCMSSAFGWTCREWRYLRWPPQDGHPRRTAFRLLRARRLEGGGEAASAVPLRLARPRLKAFCLPGVSKVLVPCRLKVARDERRGAGAVAVSAARSGRIAMLRFTTTVTAHFCSRTRGPNV